MEDIVLSFCIFFDVVLEDIANILSDILHYSGSLLTQVIIHLRRGLYPTLFVSSLCFLGHLI